MPRSRSKIFLTPALARSAGYDAGNRSMRAAGRTVWNEQDLAAATAEHNRLLDAIDCTPLPQLVTQHHSTN